METKTDEMNKEMIHVNHIKLDRELYKVDQDALN